MEKSSRKYFVFLRICWSQFRALSNYFNLSRSLTSFSDLTSIFSIQSSSKPWINTFDSSAISNTTLASLISSSNVEHFTLYGFLCWREWKRTWESNKIKYTEDYWGSVFTKVKNMNSSNWWQYKYSTPNHQKISIEKIVHFFRKIFSLC